MSAESLAILVPTRNRADSLVRLTENLESTLAKIELATLWLYADEGDEGTRAFVEKWSSQSHKLQVKALLEPDVKTQGQRYNRLRESMPTKPKLYLIGSDKMTFHTQGWDEIVRRAYRATPDGLLLTYPKDSINLGVFGAFPILSEAWAQCTGRLTTGHFPFWFDDTWVNEVAEMAGRKRALPIELHMAMGTTQRMFHLRFWEHFYDACLPQREADALALRQIIHAHDPAAAALASAHALRLAEAQRSVWAQWSTRHAQLDGYEWSLSGRRLSPEPVPPANDDYWAIEAAAVEQLLAMQKQAFQDTVLAEKIARALAHSGQAHDALLEALRAAYAQGNASEANAIQSQLLEAFPHRPEAYLLALQHLEALGQAEQADAMRQMVGQLFPALPLD